MVRRLRATDGDRLLDGERHPISERHGEGPAPANRAIAGAGDVEIVGRLVRGLIAVGDERHRHRHVCVGIGIIPVGPILDREGGLRGVAGCWPIGGRHEVPAFQCDPAVSVLEDRNA